MTTCDPRAEYPALAAAELDNSLPRPLRDEASFALDEIERLRRYCNFAETVLGLVKEAR